MLKGCPLFVLLSGSIRPGAEGKVLLKSLHRFLALLFVILPLPLSCLTINAHAGPFLDIIFRVVLYLSGLRAFALPVNGFFAAEISGAAG